VRLLELPLTGDRAPAAGPGPGTWLSLVCAAALAVAAVIAVTRHPQHAADRPVGAVPRAPG
jgi:hypothetical protein